MIHQHSPLFPRVTMFVFTKGIDRKMWLGGGEDRLKPSTAAGSVQIVSRITLRLQFCRLLSPVALCLAGSLILYPF